MFQKCLSIILILLILTYYFFLPLNIEAKSETINDIKKELEVLKQEKSSQENIKKETKEEISKKSSEIYKVSIDIENIESDIESIEKTIETLNNEISVLENETEKILLMLQTLNKKKAYMEYLTGAKDITDLIMRYQALEQIMDYNNEKLDNLNKLVLEKNNYINTLKEKQKKSSDKKKEYQKSIKNLGKNINNIAEVTETVDNEINMLEDLIDFYQKLGCKDNDILDNCIKVVETSNWSKPLSKGKITSPFGYRNHPVSGNYQLHNGIDIGGNVEGTKIYSATNGIVVAISYSNCGGRKIYIKSIVNNEKYTVYYYHVWNIYVNVGDIVNTNTVIASVGGGEFSQEYYPDSCSTGAHLHFGVAKDWYLSDYYDYSTLLSKNINPPGFPKYGGWFYNREQFFS